MARGVECRSAAWVRFVARAHSAGRRSCFGAACATDCCARATAAAGLPPSAAALALARGLARTHTCRPSRTGSRPPTTDRVWQLQSNGCVPQRAQMHNSAGQLQLERPLEHRSISASRFSGTSVWQLRRTDTCECSKPMYV
jgi:hypothetical protein